MGSFVFKWPHPDAKDVHVTGTFDDWGKSEQLNKVGDTWEKEVNLPSADEKIYYKFVVDEDWVIDPTAPKEDDGHYNINNVLLPKDIKRHAAGSTASAGPSSSEVERKTPGGFPEDPADEQPQSFGVAPIPASSGIGNPINLAPGEKVPEQSAITDHTVDSTATTSKEGYERDASAALPAAAGVAGLGGVAALVGSAFSKPEDKQNLIPESSLPMGGDTKDTLDSGPTIQSAAPDSSTAALTAGVPLEKKRQAMVIDPEDAPQEDTETAAGVPETVKESLSEAQQSPEAAASAEAVEEKSAMEQELLKKTATSEATGDSGVTPATQTSYYGLATQVPPTVEKSMQEAHAPPEAAADSSAVAEKSAMESELLKKIPSSEEAGEPAPTIASATSETAPTATINDTSAGSSGLTSGEKIAGGAVGGMGAAGVVAALASGKDQETDAPQPVSASGDAPIGSKEAAAPTTDSLSNDEKIAGGAAGGMAAAGTVGALASGESAGQTFGGGGAFHTDPVGTVTKDHSIAKPEIVEHFKDDPTQAEQSTSGESTGAIAAGAGTAAAVGAGAVGTLGAKSSAPAAVADGTEGEEMPTAGKSSVPLEKTEGDVAEYAPVPATKTVPGVSPVAAAALSDGTEDPTLADEPAVKMMQQDEGRGDIGTGATFAHDATTTTASQGTEATSSVPAASTGAPTTTAPAPTGNTTEAKTSTLGPAAAGTTTEPTAPTSSTKEKRTSTLGPAGGGTMRSTPSASSTPVKQTAAADNSTSRPTSSANTKEKKKRNRLSRLYHKIVD